MLERTAIAGLAIGFREPPAGYRHPHNDKEGKHEMADREQFPEDDPRHHVIKLKGMLDDVVQHAREDVDKVDDPRAKALFETTAEVLTGLVNAYEHFERRSEPAWR